MAPLRHSEKGVSNGESRYSPFTHRVHIDQVAIPTDSNLNPQAVSYIKDAIAKAIDENNVRIAQNLENAGVRLKSND